MNLVRILLSELPIIEREIREDFGKKGLVLKEPQPQWSGRTKEGSIRALRFNQSRKETLIPIRQQIDDIVDKNCHSSQLDRVRVFLHYNEGDDVFWFEVAYRE